MTGLISAEGANAAAGEAMNAFFMNIFLLSFKKK